MEQLTLDSVIGSKKPYRFDGDDYKSKRDDKRLTGQIERIWNVMRGGAWRTLEEISRITNDPPASVSAQLRHLRKDKFGAHTVEREYLGDGLYRYRVIINEQG